MTTYTITMDDDGNRRLIEICNKYKRSRTSVAESILAWLVNQDEVTQLWVLGMLPSKLVPEAARLMLETFAAGASQKDGAKDDRQTSQPTGPAASSPVEPQQKRRPGRPRKSP